MKNPLANIVLFKTSFRFLQTALLSTKGHVLIGKIFVKKFNSIIITFLN